MQRLCWTIGLIVGLQVIPWALCCVMEPIGLVWIFVGAVYHLPLSWIGEPLFAVSETGPYSTILGRLVATALYLALVVIVWIVMRSNRGGEGQVLAERSCRDSPL